MRLSDFLPSLRDAWDSVKGTSKETCYEKYVEQLLAVSVIGLAARRPTGSLVSDSLQLLKKADNEESKKAIAEIEAA